MRMAQHQWYSADLTQGEVRKLLCDISRVLAHCCRVWTPVEHDLFVLRLVFGTFTTGICTAEAWRLGFAHEQGIPTPH